ncbi:hypothetical protein C8F01DRAFT_1077715 [Mycena amicta]|nr:hypothetical protein C8F01DRAFT_1077715 [Mycena amicta]
MPPSGLFVPALVHRRQPWPATAVELVGDGKNKAANSPRTGRVSVHPSEQHIRRKLLLPATGIYLLFSPPPRAIGAQLGSVAATGAGAAALAGFMSACINWPLAVDNLESEAGDTRRAVGSGRRSWWMSLFFWVLLARGSDTLFGVVVVWSAWMESLLLTTFAAVRTWRNSEEGTISLCQLS